MLMLAVFYSVCRNQDYLIHICFVCLKQISKDQNPSGEVCTKWHFTTDFIFFMWYLCEAPLDKNLSNTPLNFSKSLRNMIKNVMSMKLYYWSVKYCGRTPRFFWIYLLCYSWTKMAFLFHISSRERQVF